MTAERALLLRAHDLSSVEPGTLPRQLERKASPAERSALRVVAGGPMCSMGLLGLQRLAGNSSVGTLLSDETEEVAPVREAIRSDSGTPVQASVRTRIEPAMGFDFSHVRIHTGTKADASARSVDARAYTVGNHVVFRDGEYQPETANGQRAIVHELTHVIQQAAGPVAGTPRAGGISVSDPSDRFEQEAERVADAVIPAQRWSHADGQADHSPDLVRLDFFAPDGESEPTVRQASAQEPNWNVVRPNRPRGPPANSRPGSSAEMLGGHIRHGLRVQRCGPTPCNCSADEKMLAVQSHGFTAMSQPGHPGWFEDQLLSLQRAPTCDDESGECVEESATDSDGQEGLVGLGDLGDETTPTEPAAEAGDTFADASEGLGATPTPEQITSTGAEEGFEPGGPGGSFDAGGLGGDLEPAGGGESDLFGGGGADQSVAPTSPTIDTQDLELSGYTQCDFIEERISVGAQFALHVLNRRGNGARVDAVAMLSAVKAEAIQGIFKVDERKPALMAIRHGTGWFNLIPKGQDALVFEDETPPMMVFRPGLADDRETLAGALQTAWDSSAVSQVSVPRTPPSGRPCPTKDDSEVVFEDQPITGVPCLGPGECEPELAEKARFNPCAPRACVPIPGQRCGRCASDEDKKCVEDALKKQKEANKKCDDKEDQALRDCVKDIALCTQSCLTGDAPDCLKDCLDAAGCAGGKPHFDKEACKRKAFDERQEALKKCGPLFQ